MNFFQKAFFVCTSTCLLIICVTNACNSDLECKTIRGDSKSKCCQGLCSVYFCQGSKVKDGCAHDNQCSERESCCSDGNCRKFCPEDRNWKLAIIGCATIGGIIVIALVALAVCNLVKYHCARREKEIGNGTRQSLCEDGALLRSERKERNSIQYGLL